MCEGTTEEDTEGVGGVFGLEPISAEEFGGALGGGGEDGGFLSLRSLAKAPPLRILKLEKSRKGARERKPLLVLMRGVDLSGIWERRSGANSDGVARMMVSASLRASSRETSGYLRGS
ncbi:hypothetical protein IJ096_00510 [Candidatus Saccharibacteria bacterium]|nr:hypothetical protein [Candidatus Saccharibacteria bacterium]